MIIPSMPSFGFKQTMAKQEMPDDGFVPENAFLSELESMLESTSNQLSDDEITVSTKEETQPVSSEGDDAEVLDVQSEIVTIPQVDTTLHTARKHILPFNITGETASNLQDLGLYKHTDDRQIKNSGDIKANPAANNEPVIINAEYAPPALQETASGLTSDNDAVSLPVQSLATNIEQNPFGIVSDPISGEILFQSAPPSIKPDAAPVTSAGFNIPGLSLKPLNLANETQWISQLSLHIAELSEGKGKIKFQLDPVHLGKLKVEIVQSNYGDTIRMETQTEEARQIIAFSQGRLEQDIRQTGSRITSIDIFAEPDGFAEQPGNRNDARNSAGSDRNSSVHNPDDPKNQSALPSQHIKTQTQPSQSERYA